MNKHLGGSAFITHIDDGCLSFLIQKLNIKSFIDIGCSVGGMVNLARKKGLIAEGVDGDVRCKSYFNDLIIHDFTTGKLSLTNTYDLCWSVEFVEHVDCAYECNFIDAFCKARYLFMTHAPPGRGGYHHVNCQTSAYWVKRLSEHGFQYDHKTSIEAREKSTMRRKFVKETGLFFTKV